MRNSSSLYIKIAFSLTALAAAAPSESCEVEQSTNRKDGMHVLAETHPGDKSCITTATATTTASVSLIQAASSRLKLKAERLTEDIKMTKAQRNSSESRTSDTEAMQLKHESSQAALSDSQDHSTPCMLHRAMAAASSILQKGQTIGRLAMSRLNYASLNQIGSTIVFKSLTQMRASTVVFLLFFLFIVIVGGFAFVAKFQPSAVSGLLEYDGEKSVDLRSSASGHMKSNQTYLRATNSPQQSNRAYLPATNSPQLSMRGANSPDGAQKRFPEASRVSPGSKPMLPAKGIDLPASRRRLQDASTEAQFCPDLVVPEHCECILLLPVDLGNARSSFMINDVNGSPVLRAVPQQPVDRTMEPWRAVITTADGQILVQCVEIKRVASSMESWRAGEANFQLLRAGGELFAKLVYSAQQDRYMLSLQNGAVLHFWGNFDNNAVNLTDDANRLLGTTEIGSAEFDRAGTYCRLRVAPLADVGLALCGILCICQHGASGARRTRPGVQSAI